MSVVPYEAPPLEVIRGLTSRGLYALEQAGHIATGFVDERIVTWTKDGWPQRRIGEELGCSHTEVRRRQERLGAEPLDNRGGARALEHDVPKLDNHTDATEEVIDVQAVEETLSPVAELIEIPRGLGRTNTFFKTLRERVRETPVELGASIAKSTPELKQQWRADLQYVLTNLKQIERGLR